MYWIFVQFIEVILPVDYYSTMTGVIVDQKILHEMIEVYLPEIGEKFKEIELDSSIFTIPWLICLFTSTKLEQKVSILSFFEVSIHLNMKILIIIWDHLIIEGSVALFKSALTILQLLRNDLIKCDNIGKPT